MRVFLTAAMAFSTLVESGASFGKDKEVIFGSKEEVSWQDDIRIPRETSLADISFSFQLKAESDAGQLNRSIVIHSGSHAIECPLVFLVKEGEEAAYQTSDSCVLDLFGQPGDEFQIRLRTLPVDFDAEGTSRYFLYTPDMILYQRTKSNEWELVSTAKYTSYSGFECKLPTGVQCDKQEAYLWNQ